MMLYRVSQTLSREELLDFLHTNKTVDVVIEAIEPPDTPAPAMRMRIRKTRPARKSKVNQAILDTLAKGPAVAAVLKTGLEAAGMAPGSLSTGLAMLQRDGSIRRLEDGRYELAA